MGKPPKEKLTKLEDDAKSMAARLAQLRLEMEKERAEREHNRTAAYLWSSSASPCPKKFSGSSGTSKTQSAAYRHYAASKHSWRPPELQQNLSKDLTEPPVRLNEASSSQCRTSENLVPQSTSLLNGSYDEERAAMDFQEALKAWRGHDTHYPRPVTTSTAVSTGNVSIDTLEKTQNSYTIFQRLAMGHMSQEASFQAAQDCVCGYAERSMARDSLHTDSALSAQPPQLESKCTTQPPTSEPRTELESGVPDPIQVDLPKGRSQKYDDYEAELEAGNVLSISDMQLSQALTSRIRLPDAVHVPVVATCSQASS